MKNLIVYSIALLSLIASLSGCGREVNSQFQPYLTDFESDTGIKVSNITITPVDSLPASASDIVDGQCDSGLNTIAIQQSIWNTLDSFQQKALIYHELGHCVLHRGHTAATVRTATGTCPSSIMNANLLPGDCLKNNYQYYINELTKS